MMIPIKYRLDVQAEKEYIKKVVSCIADSKTVSNKLEQLLIQIECERSGLGQVIIDEAKRFKIDYPEYPVLCAWLVMSYQNIQRIKEYFEEKIQTDLDVKNIGAKVIKSDFKDLWSYHGLRERRKRYKKSANRTMYNYLRIPICYDIVYKDYEEFINVYKEFSNKEINNWIIEQTDMKVCPYCNISYTYNRGKSVTAQLDHFYPKAEYPMFALCFYNLIPSCSACNKIKLDDVIEFASPYEDGAFGELQITWEYEGKAIVKKYDEQDSLEELEKNISIKIITPVQSEKNNISKMRISEAYQEHKDYAGEVIKKVKTYANPKAQKLISDICDSEGITPDEITRFYFGNYMEEKHLKNRPLSKMTRDFYEEYKKIYL